MIYTDAMRWFLRHQYDDERRAMLLAHAESGKLSYCSCCCFIGVLTADHALRRERYSHPEDYAKNEFIFNVPHYIKAVRFEGAIDAEQQAHKVALSYGLSVVVSRLIRALNRWRDDRLAREEAEAHAHEPGEAEPELEMERRG